MEFDDKVIKAARTLAESLEDVQGFSTVGVGEGSVLIVYFSRAGASAKSKVPAQWDSFPVKIEETGRVRPLTN